ncbi:glucosyl transferase [Pantoea endophytica]|uniref:glucosyl transferase n=1 Tax=Pantoea endophytica TaxID=92488 RepID=UPI001AE66877|nr:glucosyl transferase [Pantoea endophytica]
MNNNPYRFNMISIIGFMALAFVILVLRRPDIITNAQPWAEDGRVWMAGIYNHGFWHSLILPQNGYYQTISRLTYGISLQFGLVHAALVSNIIAILIRCFLVGFIISERMNFLELKYRLIIAFYIILMPNIAEGFVNITNVHWYLSIYLLAVVLADEAGTVSQKTHDYLVVIISGLSGPFVVFIAPCLFIKRIYLRGGFVNAIKGINFFDFLMAVCCIIQITAILTTSGANRPDSSLGYSFQLLANIVVERIVYGSFLPFEFAQKIAAHGHVNLAIFSGLCIALLFGFMKYDWRIKSLILFPVLMIGFALARPVIALDQPQWPLIFTTESGERYFYVTNIALASLVIVLISRIQNLRITVLSVCVIIFLIFAPKHFRLPKLPESGYAQDARDFDSKSKGDIVEIRILPPGWTMTLLKK